jgi:hypothetical protein
MMRSAFCPAFTASSIFASRCPFVATMRIASLRSSQSTPLRIGRLSSVLAANAVCPISFCKSPEGTRTAFSNCTAGKLGNSDFGRPSNLNFERPHSSVMRWSPVAEMRTGAGGSSFAISLSLRAGIVMAPIASTSAVTSVETAMSRSVPEMRMPLSVVCTRRLARTGRVVLLGTAGVTAARPS